MSFSQRLNELMSERGYTDYRLAQLLGCPQSSVANWTKGRSIPHKNTIARIAELFGVSVEYLRCETNKKQKKETPTGIGERESVSNDAAVKKRKILLNALFDSLTPELQEKAIDDILSLLQAPEGLDSQK